MVSSAALINFLTSSNHLKNLEKNLYYYLSEDNYSYEEVKEFSLLNIYKGESYNQNEFLMQKL